MENTYREGQFVWRELMTSDAQKARGFYGELFGWTFQDMPMPNGTYTLISKGESRFGGMMEMPKEGGPPPCWMSYASVKDVDATIEATVARGGKKIMAESAPGVGRFGVVLDPQGAAIGLIHGETGDGPSPAMGPGVPCWETLNIADVEAAKTYYTEVLGWTVGAGPGNNMAVFSAGKTQVADAEKAPPGVPNHWLVHFVVEKLEDARGRAEKLGGKVMMAEIAIPQIGRMAIISDPLGAYLSLFEPQMPAAS